MLVSTSQVLLQSCRQAPPRHAGGHSRRPPPRVGEPFLRRAALQGFAKAATFYSNRAPGTYSAHSSVPRVRGVGMKETVPPLGASAGVVRKVSTPGLKGASGGRRRETPPERLQRAVGLQNRRLAPLSGGDGGFLSGICGMIPILAEEERRRAGRHSTVSWLWRATGNGGLWGRSRTGRASGPEGSGWEGRPGAPSLRQVLGHSFCPLGLTFSVPVKKNYYP